MMDAGKRPFAAIRCQTAAVATAVLLCVALSRAALGHAAAPELEKEYADGAQASTRRAAQQITGPSIPFLALLNPNLRAAFFALQAWKEAITSDPNGITATWVGHNVCKYQGVFCAPPPDHSCDLVVAGIDLNHANIAGTLPEELGGLTYLSLFHINTNRFTGTLPVSIVAWTLLYELDISNNLFSGPFPSVALHLPSLAFLDVRFNQFEGTLPLKLFSKKLDAIFVNDNQFDGEIPSNLGDSPASVVVLARNGYTGGIPSSIGKMAGTLSEIIFLGTPLTGCIPLQVGELKQLTVFDISFSKLSGVLPPSIGNMVSLEQLDVAHNLLSGEIPHEVCALPSLLNFTASYNFFTAEGANCLALSARGVVFDDSHNCIPGRPLQRSPQECSAFFATEQICPTSKPPPPPPPPSPPPPCPPPPSPPPPSPKYVYPSPPPPPPSPKYVYPSPPPPLPKHVYPSPAPPYVYSSFPPPLHTYQPPLPPVYPSSQQPSKSPSSQSSAPPYTDSLPYP